MEVSSTRLKILFISLFAIAQGLEHHTCDRASLYSKIGCFSSNADDMVLAISDRQWKSRHTIDWVNMEAYTHNLACRCADKTKEMGKDFFSLDFYGECWVPKDDFSFDDHLSKSANGDIEISNNCMTSDSFQEECSDDSDLECVGKSGAGYVYKMKHTQSAEKNIDGGFSEWTDWTPCSQTCGMGVRMRERACTNPMPEGQGRDCVGPMEESELCKLTECIKYKIGDVYSFQSQNYPRYTIGVRSNKVAAIIQDSSAIYKLVPALNGKPGAVSLLSVEAEDNTYLRHQNYIVKEHTNDGSQLFKDDASFYVREDRYFPGYSAFESTNFPGHFIRHYGYTLQINKPTTQKNGVAIFQKDASFKFNQVEENQPNYQQGEVYSFVSQNFPTHSIGVQSNKIAAIVPGAAKKFEIVAALNGRPGAISFKSFDAGDTYLRHQNYIVKEHKNDGSQLFKDDASFYVREDKYFPGYSAFESTNFPGHFIRHYGYRLQLNKPAHAIFAKDASFKFVKSGQQANPSNVPESYQRGEDGRYYKYFATKKTWKDAKDRCKQDGARLAVSDTRATYLHLKKTFRKPRIWIGGSDSQREGEWRWVNGSLISIKYFTVSKGEPNGRRTENCLQLNRYGAGTWNDSKCRNEYPFICQIVA